MLYSAFVLSIRQESLSQASDTSISLTGMFIFKLFTGVYVTKLKQFSKIVSKMKLCLLCIKFCKAFHYVLYHSQLPLDKNLYTKFIQLYTNIIQSNICRSCLLRFLSSKDSRHDLRCLGKPQTQTIETSAKLCLQYKPHYIVSLQK